MALRIAIACVLALATSLGGVVGVRADPPGRWRFSDETRPVKAVVIGGSVSAWPTGSFSDWIPAMCPKVEIVNRGKAKLGTQALRGRYRDEVTKNRVLRVAERTGAGEEIWLVFMAGLNSIGNPEATNIEVTKSFAAAHDDGLRVMGLTPNPWGAEYDRRWKGHDGLLYFEHTQKVVDHFFGRLDVETALGRYADGRTELIPAERADVTVDLWTGSLRDAEASVRDADKLARDVRRSSVVRARTKELPEGEKEAAVAALTARASELPRWYMQDRFKSFDAIHPNADGHREIARAICAAAPPSWGCDCASIDRGVWDRKAGQIVFSE